MVLGFNNMNMLNMNGNMFGMNMFGSGNILNQLFNGTGSIFDCGFNMFGGNMFGGNMFGGNMFGGGCSLFTNCNGSMNYNAMAGWGVANVLMGIGGAILTQHISDKRASSPDAIETDIEGIQNQIDTELDKLGSDVTEANYKDYDVKTEDWYTDKKAEIDKNILSATDLSTHKETVKKYKEAEKAFLAAKTEDANYEDLKTAYNNIKEQGKLAEEKIEAHEQAEKDLKALEAKAKKEQEKADKIKEKITDLIEKRENAEKALDKSIADKADGNKWTRNKDLDISTIKAGHSEFKNGDLQQLVFQFTQQPDGETKFKYAEALVNLDDTTFMNKATDSQKQVREWAIKYYEENKSKYEQPQA